ncbi:MAG TPA: long-chain-fatty-acid--CoA ligase [Chloroflexota bacterium]
MFVPLTPLSFKQRAVRLYGSKLCSVDGDRRYTYADFDLRTRRLAARLRQDGLEPGERVAYLAYNSAELLEGYYGVLEAGGVLLPLNIRLAAHELAYILDDAGASFILVDPDFVQVYERIEQLLSRRPRVVWLGDTPPSRDEPAYEQWLGSTEPSGIDINAIDENSVAELFYTSGTTARPKGVMLTHRSLYLHALNVLTTFPADDHEVQLHTIPLFHVNGWGVPQLLTAVGGTHVMMRKFDPEAALQLIQSQRVSRFYVVPTMMTMLLNHPLLHQIDAGSMRFIKIGGGPAPAEMIRRAEAAFGCTVIAGYGLTETSPVLTLAVPKASLVGEDDDTRYRRQASTGLPLVGVELEIVDDHGNALPWDGSHEGEIVVRSNVVMKGYWNDPEATEVAMRDGWFHTGDIATIDPEGYVLIVDRKKDIIISGGENISSVEIEKTLYECPAVLESAVIAVPDEQWGEVPLALVALRPGASITVDELDSFCRERLAPFKVPKTFEFVHELPKGGTGKILKARLREEHWRAMAKRVN